MSSHKLLTKYLMKICCVFRFDRGGWQIVLKGHCFGNLSFDTPPRLLQPSHLVYLQKCTLDAGGGHTCCGSERIFESDGKETNPR